jgi:hypothetical protein
MGKLKKGFGKSDVTVCAVCISAGKVFGRYGSERSNDTASLFGDTLAFRHRSKGKKVYTVTHSGLFPSSCFTRDFFGKDFISPDFSFFFFRY